ncbi:hypothetical protein A3B40_00165 [Candidatus Roizmanbacteria bacterium RIFCSPLOWO2_01_FULL_37_16]|uniref:Uncharacterized protein n=1 Tax=Candidatus Roizmanbacteria bacterium RIFCSPLOWO2_01_FULL_37_16 TaxID=1802058 RepID=A0A1F7INF9_9BACT|nr:MAG: hypothetical protein A3B40_00165 [Candidatus Roizmanbacteria bacterium RIFCSPLOWO2_01_FULL_37_16]
MNEPGGEGDPKNEAEALKSNILKSLEDLRPLTDIPPADQRPTGMSAEQYADWKNLTALLDVVKPPQQTTASPATTEVNITTDNNTQAKQPTIPSSTPTPPLSSLK